MIATLPPQVHFTDQAWVSDVARWPSADQYRASCLLNDQLPIVEPDGRYNVLAMRMAAHALPEMNGDDAPRRDAACRLVRLLRLAQIIAPKSLIELAAGMTRQRTTTPDLAALAARVATVQAQAAIITRRAGYPLRNDKGQWIGWVGADGVAHMNGEGHAHTGWEGVTHHSAKASAKVGGLHDESAPKKASSKSTSSPEAAKPTVTQHVRAIPIDTIHTGLNPREYFDPAKIRELAESIKANGLLQPITVREHEGSYQLIAGERRFRAMQLLGETHIPAIIQNVDDKTAHELALIENINREDMRPTETARAYKNMLDAGVSPKDLAERTGKTAEHINAHLDLLKLPEHLQVLVDKGTLPMGVVRSMAKLSTKGQEEAAERILRDDLGVKNAQRLIRTISERENQITMFSEVKPVSQEARDAHAKMQDTLGKLTDMLSGLNDQQIELASQASDAPSREAERINLMIKQLQRMQAELEKESYRREKRSAFAAVQRHRLADVQAQVAQMQRRGR